MEMEVDEPFAAPVYSQGAAVNLGVTLHFGNPRDGGEHPFGVMWKGFWGAVR